MSSKRNAFCLLFFVFLIGMGGVAFAQPIFENNTPTGFSTVDSTRQERFATDTDITVLVDLNEAANATYPVMGNFQKVEKSVPYFSSGDNAGYMSQAIAVDGNGVIHRAWIQQRGLVRNSVSTSSPAYGVVYAKSFDGGKTFTDTVSVSGTMRFDMITTNIAMTGAFSTVDLVVDSKGNPRVSYAMDWSADDLESYHTASRDKGAGSGGRGFNGVFFNYSNDGGSSWLPSNNTVVISDTTTVGTTAADSDYPGRNAAFPRMAITSTDDIFIVYQRGVRSLGSAANTDTDIMLAKMDSDSLLLGSAQQVLVGGTGTVGSMGGIYIGDNDAAGVSPDIAVGDDDILHVTYFKPAATATIAYKSVPAEDWSLTGALGWNQDTNVGASVGTFSLAATNLGLSTAEANPGATMFANGVVDHLHLFPTVVVDRERTPGIRRSITAVTRSA
jgi:hypothetical protein